jgi:hypothetical protein
VDLHWKRFKHGLVSPYPSQQHYLSLYFKLLSRLCASPSLIVGSPKVLELPFFHRIRMEQIHPDYDCDNGPFTTIGHKFNGKLGKIKTLGKLCMNHLVGLFVNQPG